MKKIYYDSISSVAYSGVKHLYDTVKQTFPDVKLKHIKEWLRGQKTYTLHKPIRRRFTRRKTIVGGIDQQWQADLADMQHFSKQNDNQRYLLCVIDVFSKFSWVLPIPNKTGKTLIDAFKIILKTSKRKPLSLQTDKVTEFKNKEFQQFLKSNKIHFFTTENPETKASIVERFQRTLKARMWKYFTYHQTRKYIDVLQNFVDGYNTTYHRSIKRSPISVNETNEIEVTQALYGNKQAKQPKLNIGDLVRINKTKRTFD